MTPPGFHGSGEGVLEVALPSMLGFSAKFDADKAKQERPTYDEFKKRS